MLRANLVMVKVSVIMSVFNDEEYISEAILSILNQTFDDYEFIIIDDGSTDSTWDIINSFHDRRIRAMKSGKNLGISTQVNTCLEKAQGVYVARMDGDDLALSERFSAQVEYMDDNIDVGICGSNVEYLSNNREMHGAQWIFPEHHPEIFAQLLFCGSFCNPSTMIRKEVLDRFHIRYDSNFALAEDYDLWYRLLRVTRGANIQKVLLKYRISESQITRTKSVIKNRNIRDIHRKIIEEIGYIGSESELDFHELVISNTWPINEEFFLRAIKWMTLLNDANWKSETFEPVTFERKLSHHLFYRCLLACNEGLDGSNIYSKAKFAKSAPVSLMKRQEMLVRRWKAHMLRSFTLLRGA